MINEAITRQYKNFKHAWIIIPLFILIPCVRFFLDKPLDTAFYCQLGISFVISIILYRYHRKIVAEIKDGTLHLYSGIGLADPEKIDIKAITGTERKSNTILTLHGKDKILLSLEARKPVLDRIEQDLKIIIKR